MALAIIPSRFAATRLPGEPLVALAGKPMIERVWARVRLAKKISRVIVATDDERILQAVAGFGGEAVMTRAEHRAGTERVAEVAATAVRGGDDIFVNVQGDEPLIEPAAIDAAVEAIESEEGVMVAPRSWIFRPCLWATLSASNSSSSFAGWKTATRFASPRHRTTPSAWMSPRMSHASSNCLENCPRRDNYQISFTWLRKRLEPPGHRPGGQACGRCGVDSHDEHLCGIHDVSCEVAVIGRGIERERCAPVRPRRGVRAPDRFARSGSRGGDVNGPG